MLRVPVEKLKRVWSRDVKTLIVTHKNADPDALASSIGIYTLLSERFGLRMLTLGFPEGPSKLSKRALEHSSIDLEYLRDWDGEYYERVVVVDTGSLEQLGSFQDVLNRKVQLVIIDHHKPSLKLHGRAEVKAVCEEATSTVEIVVRIFERLKYKPSPSLSSLMLLGLAFDTKYFQIASAQAFKTAYKLRVWGGNLIELLEAVREEPEVSEKIARLKAAQRAQILKLDDWIVALTVVGAFEASAARGLLELGADVAIVASENDKTRVSGRAREKFYRETKIHLGRDVMQVLEAKLGGSGGGHAVAGGYEGEAPVELVLKEVVEVFKSLIGGCKSGSYKS